MLVFADFHKGLDAVIVVGVAVQVGTTSIEINFAG